MSTDNFDWSAGLGLAGRVGLNGQNEGRNLIKTYMLDRE